jgi:hypothetical protein
MAVRSNLATYNYNSNEKQIRHNRAICVIFIEIDASLLIPVGIWIFSQFFVFIYTEITLRKTSLSNAISI